MGGVYDPGELDQLQLYPAGLPLFDCSAVFMAGSEWELV